VRFRSECFRKQRCEPLTERSAIHSILSIKWAATSWIFSHCRMERLESIWATSRGRDFRRHYTQRWLWGHLARGSQDPRATEGMAGPVLLPARGNRELDLRGIPPEMFPETKYDSETVQLERGDPVIFLSDGFCQAQNSEGEFLWHGKRAGGMRKLAGKFAGGDSAATDGGGGQLLVRPAATE
jgi:hypothetical protein